MDEEHKSWKSTFSFAWRSANIVAMTSKNTLPTPSRQNKTKPAEQMPMTSLAVERVKPKRSTEFQPSSKNTTRARNAAAASKSLVKPKGKVTPTVKISFRATRHTPPEAHNTGKGRGVGGGQPTLFKEEYAALAHRMCAIMGATNKELAEVLGVTDRTISNWIAAYPEFKTAVSSGKLIADTNVAAALYKTEVGYEYPDMDIRTVALGGNAGSEIVITPIIKIVQPNPTSIQWWLKNRRPAAWKDKSDVTVAHSVPDEEEGRSRFTDRMAASAQRQADMRASRRDRGMTGD